MTVDQVTERVQAGHGGSVGRQPPIDQGFGLARPFLGVVTARGPSRSREPPFRLTWTRVKHRREAW